MQSSRGHRIGMKPLWNLIGYKKVSSLKVLKEKCKIESKFALANFILCMLKIYKYAHACIPEGVYILDP